MVNEAVPLLSTDVVWRCQEEDSNEALIGEHMRKA